MKNASTKKSILICLECYSRNYHYKKQNKVNNLEVRKHCSTCNAHTIHKETR